MVWMVSAIDAMCAFTACTSSWSCRSRPSSAAASAVSDAATVAGSA
ncbi:hypothetical protein OG601_38190 [Streptomyces sp. NBC_01239]|nr:hypothetical protein [Streptomyces sp. NBC_01239]MCX4816439.1 hypothetical protein [Streptomyces sp. NBC_01239]